MKRLTTIFTLFLAIGTCAIAQSYGRAYLGIYSNEVSTEKAKILGFDNPYGSYVTGITKNSAAETAGIQPLDYVYGINDEETSFTKDLTDLLGNYKPGDKATVHFIRAGKKMSKEVTFGKPGSGIAASKGEKAFLGVSPHRDNSDSELGVKVYIVANSTAEKMGMQDGDVIISINGYKMVDWSDISMVINTLKVGENIAIEYERNGKSMKARHAIQSQEATKKTEVYVSSWNPDKYAYLGIYSNTVSGKKANLLNFKHEYGSYITKVLPNSAAAEAGLQPFDYVYGVNDYRTNKDENLTKILKRFEPGEKATLHFIRNGEPKTVEVTFGKRSESETFINVNECDSPLLGVREMGSSGSGKMGVAVEIVKRSTAEEMGMQEGDIITKINGFPIVDWSDISTAVDLTKVGETVTVEFQRNGKIETASKPIKSYCDTHTEDGRTFYSWDAEGNAANNGIEDTPIRDVDAANAIVDLKDMTPAEIDEMKNSFGVQMSKANDLNINKLSITPNTKSGKYQLQFNLPQEGETSVNVYNAAGRLIYNYDLGNFRGDFNDQIDISQNGIGSYYLEVRQGNKAMTKKILLQTR